MLTQLRLTGFKSFVDQTISLSGLTVLVGANASGKSNVLDALRFLQGISLDMSLGEVLRGRWEGGRQVWPGLRGGVADVTLRGASEFGIESSWSLGGEEIVHRIACETGDHPLLCAESLRSSGVGDIFNTSGAARGARGERDGGGSIRATIKRTGSGKGHAQSLSAARSLLFQVETGEPVAPEVRRVRDAVTAAMRRCYFLDITPSLMRGYVHRTVEVLGLEGENVSALAWSICQDPEARQDLVDWLTELCAPELEDIDFAETELGDVMLVLVEEGGRRIPARSLSDGTLRFLGELIALRTAPEGSLLLIEEIENGLHPTRSHLLVEAMEAATASRHVQVIVTTHSPLVLNALSPEALRDAVLVGRPPGSAGSVLLRLGDVPDFEAVCERRGVDRMLAAGWLERAL